MCEDFGSALFSVQMGVIVCLDAAGVIKLLAEYVLSFGVPLWKHTGCSPPSSLTSTQEMTSRVITIAFHV